MPTKIISNEVWVADDAVVQVARADIAPLQGNAARSTKHRARLCAHPDSADRLHEMLIVLAQATYVQPHKHVNKSESFHVIEGRATIVLFDDDGAVRQVVPLGDYRSGRAFYYRLNKPWFHTVLVESPVFIFHEVTNGPFDRADTQFAAWAPPEDDAEAARRYSATLAAQISEWSHELPEEQGA